MFCVFRFALYVWCVSPLLNYPPFATLPLGPLTVYLWGIFVGLGILAATWVAVQRGRRSGIAPQQLWDLAFWVVLAGIVGARALYVAEYWRDFVDAPWRAIAIWEGGMSAFGAIVFGVAAGQWFARQRRISFLQLANVVAPSLLLGDAVGRLGGASSHMYPGTPTTFPISYVLDGVQRHEVGIELALVSIIGFLPVLGMERFCRRIRVGSREVSSTTAHCPLPTALLVLLWYSLERFLFDFLRASDLPNSDLRYAGFTLAQLCAMGGVAAASWLWWRGRLSPERPGVDR